MKMIKERIRTYKKGMHIFDTIKIDHSILIATYHKTGTVWLGSIFKEIAIRHGLRYEGFKGPMFPEGVGIFLENHSRIDQSATSIEYRGIHIVRDPRDVLVSGCFYHQKSEELWLHEPRDKLNGQTYQQAINDLGSIEEKINFELDRAGGDAIRGMQDWDYKDRRYLELKFEDLIVDYDLELFHKIFIFLGFTGEHIPSLLNIAYHNSLFSKKGIKSKHVRSGGESQWSQYFDKSIKDKFKEMYGESLITLGYESSLDW
jgi:hypothetical protein